MEALADEEGEAVAGQVLSLLFPGASASARASFFAFLLAPASRASPAGWRWRRRRRNLRRPCVQLGARGGGTRRQFGQLPLGRQQCGCRSSTAHKQTQAEALVLSLSYFSQLLHARSPLFSFSSESSLFYFLLFSSSLLRPAPPAGDQRRTPPGRDREGQRRLRRGRGPPRRRRPGREDPKCPKVRR